MQITGRRKLFVAGLLFVFMLLFAPAKADASWVKNSNGTYSWYTSSGKLAKSRWIGKKYYVNAKGIRVTGRKKIKGKYYYFNTTNGRLVKSSWIVDDGKYYYAKSNGVLYVNGIKKIDGSYYYFGAKGVRKTGLRTVSGSTYYFNKSTGAMMTDTWILLSGKFYYFGSDGVMAKSTWVGSYYVDSSGVRVTSTTLTLNGTTYTFDSNGIGTAVTTSDGRAVATVAVESTYYTDTLVDDETLLAAVIYLEAGNQTYAGQLAVGLVILNRMNSSRFAASTMREVVYAEGQFSTAKSGRLNKALNGTIKVTDSCKQAAAELMVLNETYKLGVTPTLTLDDGSTIAFPYVFFMTPTAYAQQGLTSEYITIGGHVFFSYWTKS
ncbi:MAG: cell wall hydrolase [Lachnospiraceae bacterium]|nr:cell wall hydrolase [Lachnospiraceae bacterium]